MPTVTPGAIVPAVPYPNPVPPPLTLGVSRVAVTIDAAWLPYVIGCCKVLTANSTFDPPDPGPALAAIKAAYDLLNDLSAAVPYVPPSAAGSDCCDCCEDCMQLRYNNCTLQIWDCVQQVWVDVPTVGTCVTNPAPGGGTTQPPGGGCATTQLDAFADTLTPLPWAVTFGDTIDFTSVLGSGNDGGVQWYCPDGSIYFLGACAGGGGTSSGDPLNTTKHMALLLKIGSSYYPLPSGVFTVPSGVTAVVPYIQVNDPTVSACHGKYTIAAQYCNHAAPPSTTWRAHIDFKTNSGGFAAIPLSTAQAGVWTPGSGWTNTQGISSGVYVDGVFMRLTLASATNVTSVEIKGSKVDGNHINPGNTCFLIEDQSNNDLIPTKTFGSFPTSPFDMAGTGHSSVTQFNVLLWDYEDNSPGTYGTAVITDLYLAGTGTIPPELAAFSY